MLNLTEYSSTLSIAETAGTVTGNDMMQTRNFFRKLHDHTLNSPENSNISSSKMFSSTSRNIQP